MGYTHLDITRKVGTRSSFLGSGRSITSGGVVKRRSHRLADNLLCFDLICNIALRREVSMETNDVPLIIYFVVDTSL